MEKAKKEINVQLGKKIRIRREEYGYTREYFSEKIDISPRFLADIEAGVSGISLTTLKSICESLDISSDYLLGVVEEIEHDKDMIALKNIIGKLSPTTIDYAPRILKLLNEMVEKHNQTLTASPQQLEKE